MTAGEEAVARARSIVGCPFRPHGRDVARGVDCVGVVAHAWQVADAPAGYALRTTDIARLSTDMRRTGFQTVRDPQAGDVVVLLTDVGTLHLGIDTGGGIIHADAVVRRVVERPGPPPWPVVGRWRGAETGELQTWPR